MLLFVTKIGYLYFFDDNHDLRRRLNPTRHSVLSKMEQYEIEMKETGSWELLGKPLTDFLRMEEEFKDLARVALDGGIVLRIAELITAVSSMPA